MLRPAAALGLALLALPVTAQDAAPPRPDSDPFLWLEDVEGDSALAWVEARNAETLDHYRAGPDYGPIYDRTLELLTATDRVPFPSIRGDWLYNFWTDDDNPRGLWRRTSWDDYLGGDPTWETLLDVDALGEAEGVNWAYKGASCLEPEGRRCLVRLSRGGADAVETREFDVEDKAFVNGGFLLPEAKGATAWIDEDEVLVATDFGDGSMTTSGYPRVVKRWRRGTPLASAETVYEGEPDDVGVWAASFRRGGETVPVVVRRPSFFEGETYVLRDGSPVLLDLPADADAGFVADRLTVYLRSEWEIGGQTYPQGALLGIGYEDFLAGDRDFEVVFAPSERQTVEGTATTENYVLVSLLDNVSGELRRFRWDGERWDGDRVEAPPLGSVDVVSASDDDDRFFFAYSSFLQPTTLYLAQPDGSAESVRSLPARFDASGLVVEQHEATSDDGTRVPYFLVAKEGADLDGQSPTLLYGYGGFEVALTPSYNEVTGAAWLERGGVYALANIRGGGEFGPAWHRAAQRENRQRAFDDFVAVAEDLVARGVTSPEHLGIMGGSNGGLLVGAAMTQRPDLFGAVVVGVPLLDMRRYHKLLAGASWMAEYGDPDDPDDWAFIREYSPYQNVDADADYPVPLFTTTTRDDRVHPGHARKMAALMESLGHPVRYFENTEGGHGSGVTPEQRATTTAVTYGYLWDRLR
ncbi:prolyl oligopeptidase family serine peptidase [Rubrivirga sp. S365]|uniref:prolyl oligopeptidase family serine peptidase n=1 Tax=Rubrivirga sp. S365 TaxID=3076080 RepID=UPI0028C5889A|nr:prolyl oligopeptidase family serine peptidase [Rubrivirga sp. S365]MDT7857016.1 prolyl oligopeptidase family serine peptidase [Rubrivirga sp. S365]